MKVTRAVITAAAPKQRALPLQTLVDSDGITKTALHILVEEALQAGIESICVVVHPGDEAAYREAVEDHASKLEFVPQPEARGYGHALYCAREWVGNAPFLHMVGDHLFVSATEHRCARQAVEAATLHSCAVSGVLPTREHLLPTFGAIGGQRVAGATHLYQIERVLEKPTPTQAEQYLDVPGLRAGHYLCLFGIHVLTPAVMEILHRHIEAQAGVGSIELSPVLSELAGQERYLALELQGRRYPIDARYGLLTAQLALALSGKDREEVLAGLCELLAQRDMNPASH